MYMCIIVVMLCVHVHCTCRYTLYIVCTYCDLRGRIKGTARTSYPVFVERTVYGQYCLDNIGHKAR